MSLLQDEHLLPHHLPLVLLVRSNHLVHIHPARDPGGVECLLVVSGSFSRINDGGYLSTKEIEHLEMDAAVGWELIADRGRRIEGIGIVLEQLELLRWGNLHPDLLCPTLPC